KSTAGPGRSACDNHDNGDEERSHDNQCRGRKLPAAMLSQKRRTTMKHIAIIIALFVALLTPAFGRGHSSSGFSGGHSYRPYRNKSYGPRSYGSRGYSRSRRHRSRRARAEFQHAHPCPSTGRTSGACPGYVVDHVRPLACGGADAPGNMQWQSTADAKAKDK